jgi:KUP system potassium uptake protein
VAAPPDPSSVPAETPGAIDDGHGGRHGTPAGLFPLVIGALGIVYGDIGTSPLYAFRETFDHHDLEVSQNGVVGAVSLVFWALTIVISLKYLILVMRADNRGEGGILALTSLLVRAVPGRLFTVLTALGIFGTALLYGDGMITPAISVLAAVEGVKTAAPALEAWVIPIAIAILTGLFLVQKRGTAGIGRVFGPIMVVWFVVLGLLGVSKIVGSPDILRALNPIHVIQYFQFETKRAFLSMGAIFLVVTGGEALYADMGHFGRRPISLAWYTLALPALVLNYLGQGAYVLDHAAEVAEKEGLRGLELTEAVFEGKPLIEMAPTGLQLPLVILSVMATIIASQALISGVFSLTAQAVKLDYLPRIDIQHTSGEHSGQIYVPLVNWLLMLGCVGLVLGFQTSSNLAAAYGIAVTMTMAITTLIFYRVTTDRWGWKPWKAFLVCIPMLGIELVYLGANVVKIPHGGWFALLVALVLMAQMSTWRKGRELVAARIARGERPIEEVLEAAGSVTKVPGTAVYLFKDAGMAPPAFVNNLRHNKVIHKDTLLVSVNTLETPRAEEDERFEVTRIEPGVHQVVLNYGFMEEPDVPAALANVQYRGLRFDPDDATYFLGHESVKQGKVPGMHPFREHMFVWLNRGADSASRFFNLPADRVFEVGTHVEI